MMMFRHGAALLSAILLMALAGCNKEIVRNQLTEDQANEISVALFSMKLSPSKEFHDKAWQISVPRDDYAFALAIIQQYGLPRARYQSAICDQFKKDGMISSGMEDRGRSMCAKSHDLETALRSIDGVVWPSVSVNIPGRDPLAEKSEKPTAYAFIKHKPNARIEVDKIRQMVRDSLSGLQIENVSVSLNELQPLLRADFQPQGSGQTSLPNLAFAFAGLGIFALVAGGLVWWLRRRPSQATLPVVVTNAGRGTQ
jgi:type III secretion system YscJ/HrcJ family lipoprotein